MCCSTLRLTSCLHWSRLLCEKVCEATNPYSFKECRKALVVFGGYVPVVQILCTKKFYDSNRREIKESALKPRLLSLLRSCLTMLRETCYTEPSLSYTLSMDDDLLVQLFSLLKKKVWERWVIIFWFFFFLVWIFLIIFFQYSQEIFECSLTLTEEILASRRWYVMTCLTYLQSFICCLCFFFGSTLCHSFFSFNVYSIYTCTY